MSVLTKRETSRRTPLALPCARRYLTEGERTKLAGALPFLRLRVGSGAKLAAALGVARETVARAGGRRSRASASLALRAARLAGVPLEDVLSGAWPGETCPCCGGQGRLSISETRR